MIIKSEYICINFQMNISTTVQYVKVLTSNHSWAPAGSQADKPPFLLCIINMKIGINIKNTEHVIQRWDFQILNFITNYWVI